MGDRPASGRPGRSGPGGRGPGGRGGRGDGNAISTQEGAMKLANALRGLQLSAPKQENKPGVLATRPGFGTAGAGIKVLANYFKVEPNAKLSQTAVHYDVDITDPASKVAAGAAVKAMPPKLCHQVMLQLAKQQKWPSGWGFDRRKNLYAPTRMLPQAETIFEVSIPEDESGGTAKPAKGAPPRVKKFRVAIKEVALVDINYIFQYIRDARQAGGSVDTHRQALQVLDVVMRWVAANDPSCITIGSAFYYYNEYNKPLGGGVMAWEGFKQSLKACQGGLMLNIDATFTGMLKAAPLVEVMAEMLGCRQLPQEGLRPHDVRKLKKLLYGVKVVVSGGPYLVRKTIRGLSERGADQLMFHNEKEGRNMSVAEYFASTSRRLRYPKLPCIDVSTQADRNTYIPVELCKVQEGQRRTKLDANQTSKIIDVAAQQPGRKQDYIQEVVDQLLPQAKPVMEKWGLGIKDRMSEVDARVLPSPVLAYKNPTCFDVGPQGSWNLANTSFIEGKRLETWAVASLMTKQQAEGNSSLQVFLKDLYTMLTKCGVAVAPKPPPVVYTDGRQPVGAVLEAAVAAAKQGNGNKVPQLILVLLPDKDVETYKLVKRFSDAQAGFPSQCFVAAKAGIGCEPRGRPQYCANLALKINAKLDGVNAHVFSGDAANPNKNMPILKDFQHVLVLGADVTHPAPGQRGDESARSIAAIVGSKNPTATKYAARMELQAPNDYEVITNLEAAVKSLIWLYKQTNNARPQAILFYRDGVAEGQFDAVLAHEYTAIKKACASLADGYNPPVAFIVVQKRHNTRLLPAPGAPAHQSGNIMPGTVVDRTICSPLHYDFFLNSHAGLKGTNKPAHYHVLVDEIGCGPDAIQLLTYWMCFTYCRATKSVSYCPPAYYAHLVAFRGRALLEQGSDSSSDASGATATTTFKNVHHNIENLMYYA